jgi:2-isopropylmalate synthase
VQLNIDGRRIIGAAFDHDTISASLKAVLSALNRKQSAMIKVA